MQTRKAKQREWQERTGQKSDSTSKQSKQTKQSKQDMQAEQAAQASTASKARKASSASKQSKQSKPTKQSKAKQSKTSKAIKASKASRASNASKASQQELQARQASKQAGKQASKLSSTQARKHPSTQASKQTSKQAGGGRCERARARVCVCVCVCACARVRVGVCVLLMVVQQWPIPYCLLWCLRSTSGNRKKAPTARKACPRGSRIIRRRDCSRAQAFKTAPTKQNHYESTTNLPKRLGDILPRFVPLHKILDDLRRIYQETRRRLRGCDHDFALEVSQRRQVRLEMVDVHVL